MLVVGPTGGDRHAGGLTVRLTPAFCYYVDAPVEVAGLGTIPVSVAYGGMTYAMVDAAALGFAIEPSEARELCALGQRIKAAAAAQLTVAHPENRRCQG